jgi:hydrogenase-4 component E
MNHLHDPLLVLLLLLNLFLVGTSRLRTVINASAVQGILLGVVAALVHGHLTTATVIVGAGAVLLKGVVIPRLLHKAMRDAAIYREVEPFIGFVPSLLVAALGTVAALMFSRTLPLVEEHRGSLLLPTSFATIITGFLILTTRRKAITQVVGYLVMENGIFVMGLTLLEAMPFLVEVGALLDLFVGIFVMGIIIHHISREYASLDTARMSALKE